MEAPQQHQNIDSQHRAPLERRQPNARPALTIGRLAQRAAVAPATVRFYERIGLLRPPQRSPSNYRNYNEDDLARLRFIRRTQEMGFTLTEVSELLASSDAVGGAIESDAIAARIRAIDQKIRVLAALRDDLERCTTRAGGPGAVDGLAGIQALLTA